MIIYLLDEYFERKEILNDIYNIIWTERWGDLGDFLISLPYTLKNASIKPGTPIDTSIYETSPMLIETVEVVNGSEKKVVLKGRSIDVILKHVHLKSNISVTGSPERMAAYIINMATSYDAYGKTFGRDLDISMFESVLTAGSNISSYYETDDRSLFDQISSILNTTSSWYRIIRRNHVIQPQYKIHMFKVRKNEGVTLSTALQDFENFSVVKSISNYKNAAYVRYKVNDNVLYMHVKNPQFGEDTALGWEFGTRMTLVDATDISLEDYDNPKDFYEAVRFKGILELAKNKYVNAFDGKLNPAMRFQYGSDYKLGDIIGVVHENSRYSALVKEYIISSSENKTESYPTLEFLN